MLVGLISNDFTYLNRENKMDKENNKKLEKIKKQLELVLEEEPEETINEEKTTKKKKQLLLANEQIER